MSTTTSPRAPALPLRTGPVRFMVVAADGKSSNSWRFWTQPAGDAYVACRDNFKEGKISKISLHTSGHWRMAWDETAVAKNPALVAPGGDRVWEKGEPPPPFAPGVVAAVRLVFPTSELAIEPAQRTTKPWKAKHVAIEAAPQGIGKMTVVTLLFPTARWPPARVGAELPLRLLASERHAAGASRRALRARGRRARRAGQSAAKRARAGAGARRHTARRLLLLLGAPVRRHAIPYRRPSTAGRTMTTTGEGDAVVRPEPVRVRVTAGQPTISTRSYFSSYQLWAAENSAGRGAEIEAAHSGDRTRFEIEHRANCPSVRGRSWAHGGS